MLHHIRSFPRRTGITSSLGIQRYTPRTTAIIARKPWSQVRHESLEAGEDKTGHLKSGADKAIFYFDSVYPLRLTWLFAFWQAETRVEDMLNRVQRPHVTRLNPLNIIKDANATGTNIEYVPRIKEGGAFVKITLPDGSSSSAMAESIKKHLKESDIKPWWNPFQRARANLVRGKPWVEDLYRQPSPRLKVEFLPTAPDATAAELTQEQLYEYFRPYGKLGDIVSQPSDSKILPKFAFLDFMGVRRAAMAKNCLHGLVIPEAQGGGKTGTLLRITYEQKAKSGWIKDWLFNHPRIVIPIVAALIAALTVAIFDPIRTFFIKAHITHFFHLTDNRVFRWLRSQATDIFTFRRKVSDDASMDVIWDDRKESIDQIRTWLMESTDTFIIIQGARGTGKKDLVEKALNHRQKLVIDCKPIQEARGDSATINSLATQVGFRPVFSFMNTISGWIDLAAQGATGVKTGFSETLESQVIKIFNNTATALRSIALDDRHKERGSNLSDEEYLETHPEKRVVVVIDNFLHKAQESAVVYDKLAEWAAALTTGNIAHVVFLTHDVSFSKSLSKALPDRVFRQLSLSDSSPSAAKQFVISRLDADGDLSPDPDNPEKKLTPSQRRKDLAELDECMETVGGRLTDLEFLARRIKMGETPRKAVREIVEQSASEILKMYLFNSDESQSGQRRWLAVQSWLLIKQLAASDNGTLRYNEVILNDTFKNSSTGGPDAVLQALEQAELISVVVSSNGRPNVIKPGKPVYLAAFRRLTEDRVLASRLDLAIATELIKIENTSIDKYEGELKILGDLPRQPYEVVTRVRWLLGKIAASHAKVEKYENESSALKAILSTES